MAAVDYPDWSVPQTNANSIAATGVPLLSLPGLISSGSMDLTAGSQNGIGTFAIGQVSYEVTLSPWAVVGGSGGPLMIQVTWTDPTAAVIVDQQTWYVWPANLQSTHNIIGRGPASGANMSILFQNFSSAATYRIPYKVFARSHPYLAHDWRSQSYTTTQLLDTIATNDPTSLLLGTRALPVNAGANDISELPLYSGPVLLYADTTSAAADMQVTIQDSANPNGVGLASRIMKEFSNSNGVIQAVLYLPRYQCKVVMMNGNAAAKTLFYTLHATQ